MMVEKRKVEKLHRPIGFDFETGKQYPFPLIAFF